MYGRWKSSMASAFAGSAANSTSSAFEPTHIAWAQPRTSRTQRRAPVPFAAERPVDVVLQPVAEAPRLDVFRVPVDLAVACDQLFLLLRRADVPAWLGVVEQRRAAAPAERVGVLIVPCFSISPRSSRSRMTSRSACLANLPSPGSPAAICHAGRSLTNSSLNSLPCSKSSRRKPGRVDDPGAVVQRDVVGRDDAPQAVCPFHVRHRSQRPSSSKRIAACPVSSGR